MKYILTILSILAFSYGCQSPQSVSSEIDSKKLFEQDNNKTCYFKSTYYDTNNTIYNIENDTLLVDSILDINFYSNHFNEPSIYPKKFIHSLYKDTIIVEWSNNSNKDIFGSNWSFTTVYDSLCRAIKYTYSGCIVCAELPYHIKIFYDRKNRPIRIGKSYGIGYEVINNKKVKSSDQSLSNEEYLFQYNESNNIILLKHFSRGKLSKQIEKI